MKISQRTLKRLGQHVTGDSEMTPYRSGPKLVELFNEFGFDDEYAWGGGFPSRWMFAEEKLKALNGKPDLSALIEQVFDPLESQDTGREIRPAVDDINAYLQRDGFEVTLTPDGRAKVHARHGQTIDFQPSPKYAPSSREFIEDHVKKCERKLAEGDFAGAITNARSLSEEVLRDIESNLDPDAKRYDGDLPKLFKRVRRLLEGKSDADIESVAVLQRGLTTVVDGLAGMSNALGDRHGGGGARATEHHARLAVNAANTLCTYVVSTFVHQIPGR